MRRSRSPLGSWPRPFSARAWPSIDGTVVNVALPALQRDLGATVADVQWVVEAYALLLSALLLVGGSMGDRFGCRRVYAIGVALFAAASAGCGLAGTMRNS